MQLLGHFTMMSVCVFGTVYETYIPAIKYNSSIPLETSQPETCHQQQRWEVQLHRHDANHQNRRINVIGL